MPVTVRKRPLTVKAVGQSISYGDAKPSFGYLLTGFVPGQSQSTVSIVGEPTFDCTYEPGDAVGEYDVALVSVEGLSSANYSFVADPTVAKLIVVRKEVTVTPISTNKVYRAAEPTLTAKVEGLVLDQGEDLIVFELFREADEDVGEYEIVAVGVAEQGNYHVTFRTGVFEIKPATLTEASAAAQTYTGAALTPVLTVLAGTNTVPSAGYTVDEWNPPALLDAGTYTATVKGRGNFTGSVEVSFVVRKATIRTDDIVFEGQTVTYNGKQQSLVVANLPSGISVTFKNNAKTDVDTYEVTAMFAAEDSTNYAVSLGEKKATLKIEPAEISSAVADAATYTGMVQTPTLTVRAGALTLGTGDYDIADWDPESPKDADSYTAKVVGRGNYTGTAEFSFRINPAKVTVTADDKEKNYGEDDPEFTATVTGMVNGEIASILAYSFTREKAGTKEGESVGYYPKFGSRGFRYCRIANEPVAIPVTGFVRSGT